MHSPLFVLLFICGYVALLFILAISVEKSPRLRRKLAGHPLIYALSLAVYCTSWTFYGSVGKAANSGISFLAIYLGPTLCIICWWWLLRKLVRIKHEYRITRIADFISARFGKSQPIAALATLLALIGTTPYIALQLKAVISTFGAMTDSGNSSFWSNDHIGPLVVILMALFTIMFGARRLDHTERHEGMMTALAVECLVKLVAFLAAGLFVTYGLFNGFGDISQRLAATPFGAAFSTPHNDVNHYLSWMTLLLLAGSAILFLPRQFHVAVVENCDEKQIKTAMWAFPLYLLLINLFVVPIAYGGLLLGYSPAQADSFVLLLPLQHGPSWLSLLVFIGGFSAATGMIIVSSMANATMVSNHLILPLVESIKPLQPLRRHLLQARWVTIVGIMIMGYLVQKGLGDSHTLVNMGLISFAAVLQFAPVILAGLFWPRANRVGALLGLGAGFFIWAYTMLLPSFAASGWIPLPLIEQGPFGISVLRPEGLFGLTSLPALVHTVFWSLLGNIGLLVFGSLLTQADQEEQRIAESFDQILQLSGEMQFWGDDESLVDWESKRAQLEQVIQNYLSEEDTDTILNNLTRQHIPEQASEIAVVKLAELLHHAERALAGHIGTAAAYKAIQQDQFFSHQEQESLAQRYGRMLADLRISPEEMKKKLNYHQEKENLLAQYSEELQQQVSNRTRDLQAAAEVMRVAISYLDPKNLIDQAVNLIRERFELDYVGLYLVDPSGAFAERKGLAQLSIFDSTESKRVDIGSGPVGKVIQTNQRALVQLVGEGAPGEQMEQLGDLCFELVEPLTVGDKVIGALELRGGNSEIGSEAGQDVMATLGGQIAVAISNARLYQSVGLELAERKRAEAELAQAYQELKETQSHLLQQEKMASIGQLAAGVAHEINNPMGFITSNLSSLGKYTVRMKDFIATQQQLLEEKVEPESLEGLFKTRKKLKLDLLLEDVEELITESLDGAERVKEIVLNLKNFSRVDAAEQTETDLNECLESTLKIVWNEIKYKATVEKNFGDIPPVHCYPQQLNQVFMNLIVNAAHAIEDQGVITIATRTSEETVEIAISDTGCGIPEEVVPRIFEPFFTTKDVGKGTGLGLSISYDIVKKHDGQLSVESSPGEGTTFTVSLPQREQEEA